MQYCYQPPVRFCRMSYDMGAGIFEQPLMGFKKVMVVDSSKSIREMLAFILQSSSYEVIQAVDGQDALDKLKLPMNSGVNLFIVAYSMPRMDGLTLTRKLRGMQAYKATPIVITSTAISDTEKALAKAAGATGWLVKPFDPVKVVDVVRKLIG